MSLYPSPLSGTAHATPYGLDSSDNSDGSEGGPAVRPLLPIVLPAPHHAGGPDVPAPAQPPSPVPSGGGVSWTSPWAPHFDGPGAPGGMAPGGGLGVGHGDPQGPGHDDPHGAPGACWSASGVVGASAATGLSWSYNAVSGLHLTAGAGYLDTASGNGGFTLDVRPDGAWVLHFTGSNETVAYGIQWPALDHGASAALNAPPGAPPAGNTVVDLSAPQTYDGTAGHENIFAGDGRDIILGGPGDYMNGGGGLNCAAYTGPQAVLVDLQHGHGYGGNAEGDSYVNMEQARGSAQGSILLGNSDGSDLKSGGANSVLISTGGAGTSAVGVTEEMRPDGPGCLLVSTVGADHVVFDPTHGWQLGDAETMVGFDAGHGDYLDLTAAQQNWVSGQSNITDYVKLVDESDGTHVMFSPDGHVATDGSELIDLKLDHGLDVHQLYANHSIVI